eukprot:jgi/Botrbrau1/4473/Bobra.0220s0007.1
MYFAPQRTAASACARVRVDVCVCVCVCANILHAPKRRAVRRAGEGGTFKRVEGREEIIHHC